MKSKQLILLGLPGVDVKGQVIALSQRWHVPYVSMDELLNEEIAKASELGLEASVCVEKGVLVPDAVVMRLLQRRVEQPDMWDGWVLVGFGRSLAQAQAFDDLLLKFERPAVEVVYLKVTTGLLINRLSAEEGESVTAIRQRLTRYQAEIDPLLDYYQQHDRLRVINGNRSAAEVTSELSLLGEEETGAARFIQGTAELDLLVARESLLVVYCMASWCGSCKQVTPLIDRLAEEHSKSGQEAPVEIVKLDFDSDRTVAKRFELKGMPSVMFFAEGKLMETLTGQKSYREYSAVVARFLN